MSLLKIFEQLVNTTFKDKTERKLGIKLVRSASKEMIKETIDKFVEEGN